MDERSGLDYFTQLISRGGDTLPDGPAILFESHAVKFGEVTAMASAAAGWLRHCLEHETKVVGLVSANPWLTVRMQLGCLKGGLALYPFDPALSSASVVDLCEQAGCRHLVTDVEGALSSSPLNLIRIQEMPGVTPGDHRSATRDKSQIALIVATSGTSGDPKGVMLSYRNLLSSASASRMRLGLTRGDLWLNCLPLHHIGGLSILYRCLEAGAAMLLHRGFRAERVWDDLKKKPVTHLSLVPAMLYRLLEQAGDSPAPESLKVVLIGGSALDPGLESMARRAGWPICVTYGMTETSSQVATLCGDAGVHPAGYVGKPLDGFRLAIGTDDRRIRVSGRAVMAGYANPEHESGDGLEDGWFETGDIGEFDPEGGLRILGRADDCLVSGGRTLHPLEIERRLAACPGLASVAVSGRPDPVWGDLLVAFYTGRGTPEELDQWSRIHIPGSMRPREFIHLEDLPRNTMGKIDRYALRKRLASDGTA